MLTPKEVRRVKALFFPLRVSALRAVITIKSGYACTDFIARSELNMFDKCTASQFP